VEPGQRDELELVAHRSELLLERAIVSSSRCLRQLNDGEQLYASIFPGKRAWIASANAGSLLQIRLGRLAPDHVAVRGVGQRPGDGLVEPGTDPEEALRGPLTGAEALVVVVDVSW
jgi:hypothetical protein